MVDVRVGLTSRPLDLIYFLFFMMHLPATLLVDLQALYPAWMVPNIMKIIPVFYFTLSKDPLIGGAMGFLGKTDAYVWFKTFLTLEAFFQIPVFILGMRGLWRNSRSIYVLLLIYAASTTTTTLPCLTVVWTTPLTSAETRAAMVHSVAYPQKLMLLGCYIPFFLIPSL
ncbi:transmembrane protein 6/97 [Amylocystis lapponica]|nr:transmembrane protein 6/97 [Amylocystis lapponica]